MLTLERLDHPFGGRPSGWVSRRAVITSAPVPAVTLRRRAHSPNANRLLDIRAGVSGHRPARPLGWHGLIRFSSDRIHKAVVDSLAGGFTFTPHEHSTERDFQLAREFGGRSSRDYLAGRLGFRLPPTDQKLELLNGNRAQLIKLQFALWARAFAETDADPGRPAVVTLSQLCDDLGYHRQQNGSHRPEHKRQVAEWVALLTSIELDAEYEAPDGQRVRLTGPLWKRFPDWELDRQIAFAPGPWYADPLWRRFNRRVGLFSAALLSLRPDRDRWAICIGGYLACLARMNGYRPLTLRVATLLERTGLQEAERRNPSRMREMLERSLEQLEARGAIAQWDWFNAAPYEPDMDTPAELEKLLGVAPGWAERSLVIRWPVALQHREASLSSAREIRGAGRRGSRVRTVSVR